MNIGKDFNHAVLKLKKHIYTLYYIFVTTVLGELLNIIAIIERRLTDCQMKVC